ncbi:hypothetical protein [Archangium sp.]|uniref:hypothetical protein n=1 Tax=Archangium sp. TaxID=1872627 RepID=UPI0039C86894
MDVRAARALLREASDEFWAACVDNPAATAAIVPCLSATLAWVTETAASVVGTCYQAGGGPARSGMARPCGDASVTSTPSGSMRLPLRGGLARPGPRSSGSRRDSGPEEPERLRGPVAAPPGGVGG